LNLTITPSNRFIEEYRYPAAGGAAGAMFALRLKRLIAGEKHSKQCDSRAEGRAGAVFALTISKEKETRVSKYRDSSWGFGKIALASLVSMSYYSIYNLSGWPKGLRSYPSNLTRIMPA